MSDSINSQSNNNLDISTIAVNKLESIEFEVTPSNTTNLISNNSLPAVASVLTNTLSSMSQNTFSSVETDSVSTTTIVEPIKQQQPTEDDTTQISESKKEAGELTQSAETPVQKGGRGSRKSYQTATPVQLELLVKGHLTEELSISAAARRAGIPRSTAAALMRKYKANQGFLPRRRRGRTAPPKLLPEHTSWIDNFLQRQEDATLETIKTELLLAFPSLTHISISGLQRHITLKCTRSLKRARR
ncbi:uncharacterized protein BX664DRAFT_323712 [Halteromyces radiatus]|uniref:uncharacterized protein n=1 Tax=Halteromyces radiatus TaxID=101107 RepID=UPI00221F034A|nr:uncharacterized protein BX664DRAFT_323712 [Halteromyces radiatus]KAI8096343.1 hypothetical protein BX664DRAFT_323712 [Halteromyces radiatus]